MSMILLAADPWYLDLGIWSGVVFVLLVWVLAKFALAPLRTTMDAREKATVADLDKAEVALAEVARVRREQAAQRIQSREAAEALIAEAERDAVRTKEEFATRAKFECEQIEKRHEREIRLAQVRAFNELWEHSARIASQAAQKTLEEHLTADDHRRLVDQALAEIAAAGASS